MSENLNNPELKDSLGSLPSFSPDSSMDLTSAPVAEEPKDNKPKKWYKTSWGITILVIAALISIAVVFFLCKVFYFWWMIKSGRGAELDQNYGSTATQVVDPQLQAQRLAIEVTDSPYFGSKDAKIVIVEFVDYKCPFCQKMAPIMFKLAQTYGDKIKLIIRNFPSDILARLMLLNWLIVHIKWGYFGQFIIGCLLIRASCQI